MGDQFLGSISLVAFNFAPIGWALCSGQTMSIAQNNALFSLLGATYGGNGTTTFCLPNLNAGALQTGLNYIIALQGIFPARS